MRFGKFKYILFALVGAVALFVAYSIFVVRDSGESAVLVSENERTGRVPSSATELLRVLNDLQILLLTRAFLRTKRIVLCVTGACGLFRSRRGGQTRLHRL